MVLYQYYNINATHAHAYYDCLIELTFYHKKLGNTYSPGLPLFVLLYIGYTLY